VKQISWLLLPALFCSVTVLASASEPTKPAYVHYTLAKSVTVVGVVDTKTTYDVWLRSGKQGVSRAVDRKSMAVTVGDPEPFDITLSPTEYLAVQHQALPSKLTATAASMPTGPIHLQVPDGATKYCTTAIVDPDTRQIDELDCISPISINATDGVFTAKADFVLKYTVLDNHLILVDDYTNATVKARVFLMDYRISDVTFPVSIPDDMFVKP